MWLNMRKYLWYLLIDICEFIMTRWRETLVNEEEKGNLSFDINEHMRIERETEQEVVVSIWSRRTLHSPLDMSWYIYTFCNALDHRITTNDWVIHRHRMKESGMFTFSSCEDTEKTRVQNWKSDMSKCRRTIKEGAAYSFNLSVHQTRPISATIRYTVLLTCYFLFSFLLPFFWFFCSSMMIDCTFSF